ncbi:glycosyltransferase [Paenibacillus sp. 5J-6]|uniref:Glycosyltransferase n=1 Tax=Paenibacillus silvestris TaxID=2606219 RepID=A0A6L8V6H1_9BACL|nr:glycosyltransferase [Paenibacillus silvestris]MZQ85978.1 glycosyltransferase [Paenibacillus silvestris]
MSALRAVRAKKLPLRSLKSQRQRVRRVVKVRKQPAPRSRYLEEWRNGSDQGYGKGWSHGFHMGRCQSLMRDIPQERGILWDLKVMFVRANGLPYTAMDEGIEGSLRDMVREVIVVNPADPLVQIAAETRPDLMLVLDAFGQSLPGDVVQAIRAHGIRTAIWLPDDPYHSDHSMGRVPHFDYVFTLEKSCVKPYKLLGCQNVHYLPFGINPDAVKLDYVPTNFRKDICFIGTAFWNRVAFIDEMADYLKDKDVMINGYWWDRLSSYDKLSPKIQGYWLSPQETMKYYQGAKIVINLHRATEDKSHNSNSRQFPAFSPNPRLFDITASGTLQLTDVRDDLTNFYKPGEELDIFSSPQELIQKIEYYLTHEEERQHIALRGLARTLKDHTYRKRLNELLTITNKGG